VTPRENAALPLPPTAGVVRFGSFRFDRANGLLAHQGSESQGREIPLPPRALAVLTVLVAHAGRVVPKQELLDAAWNGAYVSETSLAEAVSLLRQALGDDPQQPVYLQTVHRRGYRFIAALEPEPPPGSAAPPTPIGAVSNVAPWPLAAPAAAPATPAGLAPETTAGGGASARRSRRLAATLALSLAALLVGAFLAGRRTAEVPSRSRLLRFAIAAPAGTRLSPFDANLAVSPDGRLVAFVAGTRERQQLYVRALDGVASRALPGTVDCYAPFFSPDGRSIGFFADGELKRVALAGGPPATIATMTGERASWGSDGWIVFAGGRPNSLYRVPATGGKPLRLTRPDAARGERDHFYPQVLPGARAVIFTSWANTTVVDSRVEWLSLRDGHRRTVVRGGAGALYAAGRLIWMRAGDTLVSAPFDPERGRLTGPPAPLLDDVMAPPLSGLAQVAVSDSTLAYLPSTPVPLGQRSLAWLPALTGDGTTAPGAPRMLSLPARYYRNLRASRDGRLAATLVDHDRSDVWVVDPRAGSLGRLTFDGFNIEPAWSPDGVWVTYASRKGGPFNVYRRRADGSAPEELMVKSSHHQHPSSWSPDGRQLMIGDVDPNTGFDLWVMDVATRRLRPLLRTPADEIYATFSPDGRWVAYCTDESGRNEIIVRSWPDWTGHWQVSTEGGFAPFWSADGRTLYFLRDTRLWGVPVRPGGRELLPGAARLVTAPLPLDIAAPAPDGGVYGVLEQRSREAAPAELRVIVDWRALLPAGH
jgi:serine/threonine-protein kinase